MFTGYKTFAYFGARLTSPPTPLRRKGELDSENLKLYSIGYPSVNNGIYNLSKHLVVGEDSNHGPASACVPTEI